MRVKNKGLLAGLGLVAIVLSSGFLFRQVKVNAAVAVCEPLSAISGETATQETVTGMEKCIQLVKDIPLFDQQKRDEIVKMEGMIPVLRSLLVARDAFRGAAEAFKEAHVVAEPVKPVEKVDPSTTFFFTFRDRIHSNSDIKVKQEALSTLRANEPNYALFAENSCKLKREFVGDSLAAGENYVAVNEINPFVLLASQKAEVYQWQFDALTRAGLCK